MRQTGAPSLRVCWACWTNRVYALASCARALFAQPLPARGGHGGGAAYNHGRHGHLSIDAARVKFSCRVEKSGQAGFFSSAFTTNIQRFHITG